MTERYIVSPHEQRSDGWYADRCGNLNGSEVDAIYATVKVGEAAGRRNLRVKLVLEGITGIAQARDFKATADMQWGLDHEPEAVGVFEADTRMLVEPVGYCRMVEHRAGCSPDGLLVDAEGKRGLFEGKCPNSSTHLGFLQSGEVPRDYMSQMRHNVWVLGYDFAVFQSFDPRFPKSMQVMRRRFERADLDIDGHERAVFQFLMEVERDQSEMKKRFKV